MATKTSSQSDKTTRLSRFLAHSPPFVFVGFAIVAAFSTYFCMYAFRKPFAVADYRGYEFLGMSLKDALLISQILGYALSKWLGVKFVSELPRHRRAIGLLVLIAWAETALLLFAILPTQFKVFALFLNGLPLGAIWGIVFGFLEGRRTSEILGAGLSCAYIVASGAVKSVGDWLISVQGVPEFWMPAATGALFLPLFLISAWLLSQVPPPTDADVDARIERHPMLGPERRSFLRRFFPGLLALTLLYLPLTAYREFRDSFAKEIWSGLGFGDKPSIFTLSELPIALAVMITLGVLYLVKSNRLGLLSAHIVMLTGTALIGFTTMAFDAKLIGGAPWMIGVGLGLYLAYVPYGCMLFDRMIAAVGVAATAVFMIYVTDATGYAGAVGVILYKHFGHADLSAVEFFRNFSYVTSILCSGCFALSALYFWRRSLPPPEKR